MNGLLKILLVSMFVLSLNVLVHPELANASTTGGYNLDEIKDTSENISFDRLGALAKEYSVPILVVMVVLSGFSALLGFIFKPMKLAAGTILGIGILFYVMVNFAPQIVGIMMAIVDSIMSRITGA